jgi:hypothetical protein
MAYKWKSLDNRRKAKRNLERLLKEIASIPKSDSMHMEAMSGLAKAGRFFMRLENVEGVHIYAEGPERWYADVVFKDVPAGYSNMIGTPTKAPVRTQAEAEDYAKTMLIMLRDSPVPEERPDEIIFPFDNVSLPIPENLYRELVKARDAVGQEFSLEYITDLMERARARIGGPITVDRFNAASQDDRLFVLTAATLCSLSGHIRWPPLIYNEEEDAGSYGTIDTSGMTDEEIRKAFPWRK